MNRSDVLSSLTGSEIAVIGLSGRFPGAKTVEEFWENLKGGVESISFFSDQDLEPSGVDPAALNDPNYVKAAPVLDEFDRFDAAFFGYTPQEAQVMDPQQRLLLECAWEALEHAGYDSQRYNGLIGVYAGARTNTYLFNLYSNPDVVRSLGAFHIGLGNDLAFLSSRISYKLDLKGPSYAVHTACSTSLVAIHLACQSLLIDECQIALAGGVAVQVPQRTGYLYQHGSILSPDGHCRAFDAQAQGTIFGSGVGVVVLKRLEDALNDGDTIHAIIRGSAANNDGALKASFTAPGVYSQAEVIAEALMSAGVDARTISYVEAHGTGTPLGDPIEIRALTKAFRAGTEAPGCCAIGSVKTNIGHLDAAAGIASFIKTVLALKHRQLPPSLHFEQPNPQIDFAKTPFYVNTSLTDWNPNGARRAGVSSFGIGGTNAHIILEEAPALDAEASARPWHLLPLSAKTDTALEAVTANLAAYLAGDTQVNLADVAYTLQAGRQQLSHRRVVVCRDRADAAAMLIGADPQRIYSGFPETLGRPVVFLFPGQGSQYPGMTGDLYQHEPVFRAEVDRCAEILKPHLGLDLREVIYPDAARMEDGGWKIEERETAILHPPSSILNQTQYAQPALFTVEYALARLWMSWGVQPAALIGHSIGEYVAACLAGVFSLEDALSLVAARGALMQQLPAGAMLAVGLPELQAPSLLGADLCLAAVNGPEQLVVSGPLPAIEALECELLRQGVRHQRLPASHAFHSQAIEQISARFIAHWSSVKLTPPHLPWISNVTGTWITAEQATDPEYWARHMRQPVRFSSGMRELARERDRVYLEVGPGRTLGVLARQHLQAGDTQTVFASLPHQDGQQLDTQSMLTTLGRLWLAGVAADLPEVYRDEPRRRLPLPTYPFERQRYWVEPQPAAAATAEDRRPTGKQADIADWFYRPVWKQATLLAADDLATLAGRKAPWLIFGGDDELSSMLLEQLAAYDCPVTYVIAGSTYAQRDDGVYTIDPRQPEDYHRLLSGLAHPPRTIVHLWSMCARHEPALTAERFGRAQDFGFYSLIYLAKALGKQPDPGELEILAVTEQVYQVTGVEQLRPEHATLLGACRVIPQEQPRITCRHIDLDLPPAPTWRSRRLARLLLAECTLSPNDLAVAYRAGGRWVQTFEPLRLPATDGRLPIRQGGVYLITGGLGDIGFMLAEYLAKTAQARLVLIGRTPIPPRTAWEDWLASHDPTDGVSRKIRGLQQLESLGAEVLALNADVADAAAMRQVLERLDARFGALHGVVHAAGTTDIQAFATVQDISPEHCERHFRPKVHGLLVLDQVLQGRELDFCVLFSSLTSILGGLGYVGYAAASIAMDAWIYLHNQDSPHPWISVNWDMWRSRQHDLTALGATLAQYEITPEEGVEAFARVLATGGAVSQIINATGDLGARFEQWVTRRGLHKDGSGRSEGSRHARPELQGAYVAPRNDHERAIAEIWQQTLGIEPVGIYDNFFELGGHSLLATQVIAGIRDKLHVDLPLNKLFEQPTVAHLAQLMETRVASARSQNEAEILQLLDQMSEEEVEREILRRTTQ